MQTNRVKFTNQQGQQLKGLLELPINQHPHNFVLFAHCFTCTKNLLAVKNIARGLTANGFGVLRFDFTGLGESEGEFADTNFSGNVEDVIAAANFLDATYKAPSLLVGHSLGGAAVLQAAAKLDFVTAVATIGAPSHPEHVKHLFKSNLEEIKRNGKAVVNLSGRDFTITRQFVKDLEQNAAKENIQDLRKALLVLHSPQDTIVGIQNAEEIYTAAHHPKSFISLDGADHLLSDKEDATYVGNVIANWATRYVTIKAETPLKSKQEVIASLDSDASFTTQMKVGDHLMVADEPVSFGGQNFGPSPYELVSAGLSACTAMTVQMYAKRKNWPLENIEVHTTYNKQHAVDCEHCEEPTAKIDTFHRFIKFTGNLDQKQIARMLEIADKCPVHKTLHSQTQVITEFLD
ncbi:bifunctional alpha/beta hydrolase/OsmC family protein [Flavobacterium sp. ASW18X]|uniref:bifunctional alpha/beta hydrolase/OsmC family protein n=1 Tax=Flavobacterium sp. ASW18X TaxID=2572595 RepID=UPI0010AE234D|nr:bifunctional alpha/beta hydrolase/OsmC family protein [Flavobacterium sp. ASW18X]TKD62582.1 alpha/beta fold hydrolase [Flavobacterium sp. ASW18X]